MKATILFVLAGALLILMALTRSVVDRLPISTAMLYLGVGFVLGPLGVDYFALDGVTHSKLLMHVAEIAVLISLFASGLKLDFASGDSRWRVPVRLAGVGMVATVALIAAVGHYALDLSPGAAILLGAILAPTDPVLASDVQVAHEADRDALRFGLTGEAGLNDGTAFPFVMLGLALLGVHDIGTYGWRWFTVDLVWAVIAGFAIGAALGSVVGRLVLNLRSRYQQAVGMDEFLTLGLIAFTYGVALFLHAYGFVAVFVAGVALRRVERQATQSKRPANAKAAALTENKSVEEIATHPHTAPAYMAQAILDFNTQLEHLGELIVVIIVGILLSTVLVQAQADANSMWSHMIWFIPILLLAVRPIAVAIGLLGAGAAPRKQVLMSWFGIRGIGSIYYLMFAIQEGIDASLARTLTIIVLCVVTTSIIAHGISVTPLMVHYRKRGGSARRSKRAVDNDK